MADYLYASPPELAEDYAVLGINISKGSGAGAVKFTVQDTVYLVGDDIPKSVVVDIIKASGLLFNRPTIKRISAAGEPAREWSFDLV